MSESRNSLPSSNAAAIQWLRHGMEGVVLLLVVLSPWAYGAIDPVFEYALHLGIGLIALLWGAIALLERKLLWFACPVALSIALIFMLGVFQLVPMPSWMLTVLSPTAASLNRELRPNQPEIIAPGEPPATSSWVPRISVYPEATRQELYRWLAVLIVFAAVRNVIASTGSLRRLAWAALFNGILLSVFGIYQFFSTLPKTHEVYGFKTSGDAFGPFICRNNFPDYVNLCIGLAVSLLLMSSRSESERRASRTHRAQALVEQTAQDEAGFSILSFLHSPLQLWLSAGVALMVGAVICSMSRGGVAALVIGIVVTLILRGSSVARRATRIEVLALPIVLAFGVVAWLGINPLESRLVNWQGGAMGDGRLAIWKNLLPLTYKFPIFGSGFGTLPYVEPLHRQFDYTGYHGTMFIDHAHNDYLEAMIEGGILRLALTIAIVFWLMFYGRQAMRRHETRTPGRLALGALIGISALAVHSLVDFGITTPAVAFMAAVVAAQLAGMARSDPSEPPSDSSPNVVSLTMAGFGGVASAITLVVLAVMLAGHGSTMNSVQYRRENAFRAVQKTSPPNFLLAQKQLQDAVNKLPFDARLREELGQLFLDEGRLTSLTGATHARFNVASHVVTWAAQSPWPSLTGIAAWRGIGSSAAETQAKHFDDFVRPGLRRMIAARDLCPLLARPHARLAAHSADANLTVGPRMAQSDPAEVYWRRALMLAPYDAELLYFVGLSQLQAGRTEAAWANWRRSLERKPTHARDIVEKALPQLGADQLLKLVLPDDPTILLDAARSLAANPAQANSLRAILMRAREILTARLDLDGNSLHQLALTHRMLGEVDLARSVYKQAIAREPDKADWRYEYAEILYSLQTTAAKEEAIEQLKDALRINPHLGPAINLLALIKSEMSSR